ncbi:hypothetical protein SAY87_002421 [Trapa incisa]|uniref:Phytocyanin domain-containing protein n=1 Tax=Trapa incisa TaxID=236973 RepID=A0AAN7JWR0_9MYRT|nr:hypothetical protein SAY87_002421 [Trapa incisa]
MTSLWALVFGGVLIVLAAADDSAIQVEPLKEFKVGGRYGWREPEDNNTSMYDEWATMMRFHVGDSLVFEYHNDSVLSVDKFGYYHCNVSDPILAFNNGNSTVKLDRPGPFYFISGDPVHCLKGQRLIVEVMSPHPIHRSPPSIASPPESGSMAPAISPFSSLAGALAVSSWAFSPVVIAIMAVAAVV